MFFYDPTWILMIIAIVITLFAQSKVNSTYQKYAKVRSARGLSAHDAARLILDYNGLQNVRIEQVSGSLTDHYDPRGKVLRLSQATYHSDSVAALGIAAHEAGHAMQDKEGYIPLKIRGALVPLANIGSNFSMILIIIGAIMGAANLIDLGIIFFSFAVLFQLVTLPVEFNASSRALAALEGGNLLNIDEVKQTKKVLSAAALTYVAAALASLLQLLRFIILFGRRD